MLDVGCPPLRLAMPWLVHAFAGFLPIEQLLLLWDRVLGFESLHPLALLAAAVLRFRRTHLLAAAGEPAMRLAVGDMGQLRVVPLLQSLFS